MCHNSYIVISLLILESDIISKFDLIETYYIFALAK